ncbi:MAG: DnaJ domain-containing protein [Rhodospirillales bacterium]|nr:DnaJ domain-containing protein [Rhodospirillales bacterium]
MFIFYLLTGAALLLVVYFIARGFSEAKPAQLLIAFKWLAGAAIVAVAAWLAVSGRLGQALVLGSALAPLLIRWKSLLARARNAAGPAPGQHSDIETAWLRMSLDHDSGAMDGVILAGPLRGRRLGELSADQLLELLAECRLHDAEGAQVLEAYLDRVQPDWRQAGDHGAASEGGGGGGTSSATMTREEAYRILGVEPGASKAAIREAHRRLMMKLHPDQGGSTYLAAKINQAKDLLLAA